MKVLDLYCGAGGSAVGFHRAGFEVLGVDIKPQPRYPFDFWQQDALDVLENVLFLNQFDLVYASPPCQRHSRMTRMRHPQAASKHPDLITPTRERLIMAGVPYVIENVPGAPLINPLLLCGSMFQGLEVRRHRLFESSELLEAPGPCDHEAQGFVVGVYGHTGAGADRGHARRPGRKGNLLADWKRAMGINWMTRNELAQAIPPTYTEWIGRQLATLGE